MMDMAERIRIASQAILPMEYRRPAKGQRSLFREEDHPRGQPENAGEFAPKEGGSTKEAGLASRKFARSEKPELSHAEDYKQNGIRAKAFKAWFGDWEHDPANASKVVNEDGEPQSTSPIPGTGSKVMKDGKPINVYHGTAHGGWDRFDKSKIKSGNLWGPGFYFTEDQTVAESYRDKDASLGSLDKSQADVLNRFIESHLPAGWGVDGKNFHSFSHQDIEEWRRNGERERAGGEHKELMIGGVLAGGFTKEELNIPKHLEWDKETVGKWEYLLDMMGINTAPPETKQVYLNIRKPFDADNDRFPIEAFKEKMPVAYARWKQLFSPQYDDGTIPYEEVAYSIPTGGEWTGKEAANWLLQELGYDGITHIGGDRRGGGHHHRVWIAFEPNQIKSVNNQGTFDPKDDRMDYSRINRVIDRYHWVTIGGGPGPNGEKHKGGTPVDMEGGVVVKGPASLKGGKVSRVPEAPIWFKPKKPAFVAKGNELFDASGQRHAAFRTPERAAQAAREWNANGKPGEEEQFAEHKPERPENPELQKTPDGRDVGPAVMSVDDLHVDPQRFQYKVSGIDQATGTNAELKKVKEFNPMLGGQILVWKDPEDGKTYVVNGHHRAELAKRSPRSNDVGKFNGRMPVYFVDAKTHQEARAHGALANIAEGRGTATDAARFMRDMGVGMEDFAKVGVSPSGAVASAALELAKLSPHLFQKLSNGAMTEGRAQSIAKYLPNHDAQDQLFSYIQNHEKPNRVFSDSKVAEMARAVSAMKPVKTSGGMFDDFFSSHPIEQRADIADHIRRNLSSEHRTFREASSTRRQGVLESTGENKLDVEGNRQRAGKAETAVEEFDHRANAAGHPIAKALDAYAERLFNEPKKRAAILKDALAEVRRLAGGETADAGGKEQGVEPVRDNDQGRRNSEHGVQREPSKFSRIAARIELAISRYGRGY